MSEDRDRRLYPMHMIPVAAETREGDSYTSRYLVADLVAADTEVHRGWLGGNTLGEVTRIYLERIVGEAAFDYFGLQFPVAVRLIEVDGATPVFVNPDDTVAADRYDSFGKPACWYVAKAAPGAKILLGFDGPVSAARLYEAVTEGDPRPLLNSFPVREGDMVRIPPGTVHAAEGRMTIVEVSEASDLAFRLDEDIAEVLDFITLEGVAPAKGDAFEAFPFSVTRLNLESDREIFPSDEDTFYIYICLSGKAAMLLPPSADGPGESFALSKWDALLVPAECERAVLSGHTGAGAELLEIKFHTPKHDSEPWMTIQE